MVALRDHPADESPTSPRSCAGPYHEVPRRARRHRPRASTAARRWREHLDADEHLRRHQAGLRLLPRAVRLPLPVRQVRPALRARVQRRRDGERRLRDVPARTTSSGRRSPTAPYERRAETILHEMAHMWFGDLVTMRWWDDLWLNESFADVRLACWLPGRGDPLHRRLDDVRERPRRPGRYRQDQLPSTHPIVTRHPRRRGRRGQLRRHHLRQGRVRAQAARRLRRASTRSCAGAARLLRRRTRGATPRWPTCSRALEEASGRDLRELVGAVAGDGRRQHAARRVRGRRRRRHVRRPFAVVQEAPAEPTPARCARTGSRSASTT